MTNESTIVMYGTPWCGDCRRAKRVFEQQAVPYTYIDIEHDDDARAYVEQVNKGYQSVPTIVFPDGSIMVEPSSAALIAKLEQVNQKAA
ncbi:MAG TPA: glutaredoxin domain-containing protein [Roseiflexaceae bacterium]|nr:glutaredoxin domain-containing protein [Roseiflexaceae bacterium]